MRFGKISVFVLVSLVLISSVYATDLFNISAEYNAHASRTDSTNYKIVISVPWTVSGTNNLLWLSGNTNAHVSTTNSFPSTIPINFGSNTECKLSSGDSCDSGYSCIVKLSSATNAHAANCSSSGKGYKAFCCRRQIFWANMVGQEITTADIGDSVLMVYGQESYVKRQFEIKEYDWSINPDEAIRTDTGAINSHQMPGSKYAFGKWQITSTDYVAGGDEASEDFYFNLVGDSATSNYLNIVKGSSTNSAPQIEIIKPAQGQNYTLISGYTPNITIEQISSDEDDDLEIIWNFGDGSQESKSYCLSYEDCKLKNHSYTTAGTKTIILTATEMRSPDAQEASDYVSIFVYKEGLNIFSIIDSPIANGLRATVNGSKSKVVNCTTQSKSGTSGWYAVKNPDGTGTMWCNDLPKPGQTGANYDLVLNWIFDENTEYKQNKTGLWSDGDAISFIQTFVGPGKHTIKLGVGYIPKN